MEEGLRDGLGGSRGTDPGRAEPHGGALTLQQRWTQGLSQGALRDISDARGRCPCSGNSRERAGQHLPP